MMPTEIATDPLADYYRCSCGFYTGTSHALWEHIEKWSEREPGKHADKDGRAKQGYECSCGWTGATAHHLATHIAKRSKERGTHSPISASPPAQTPPQHIVFDKDPLYTCKYECGYIGENTGDICSHYCTAHFSAEPSASGSLWVGFAFGGVINRTQWHQVKSFAKTHKLPAPPEPPSHVCRHRCGFVGRSGGQLYWHYKERHPKRWEQDSQPTPQQQRQDRAEKEAEEVVAGEGLISVEMLPNGTLTATGEPADLAAFFGRLQERK